MKINLIKKIILTINFTFFINANDQLKISIITSLYKGGFFIENFLKDITRQTIFNKCELIIIDANSPENEKIIINKFMKRYPNIIYKRLDKTISIYAAWNMAISMSQGEYITNANVDDRLSPKCYEIHSRELDKDTNIDLVYSDSYITNIPNQKFEYCSITKNRLIKKPEFKKEEMKIECLPSFNPMWRKSVHEKYGMFDENLKIIGDSEFWIRAVKKGSIFKKIRDILGLYYNNPHGLSTDKKKRNIIVQEWEYLKIKHKDFFN